MGYYRGGDNCYGRGDYYRGDYYRGDPGILSFIGKAARGITGILSKAGIPGAGLANSVANAIFKTPATGNVLQATPMAQLVAGGPTPYPPLDQYGLINVQTGVGGGAAPGMSLTPSGALVPCQLKGYRVNKSGYYRHPRGNPQAAVYVPPKSVCVKTRRLNVANPRALRRAIRRAQGFAKLARRVMTFVSAKAPKGRAKFKKRR